MATDRHHSATIEFPNDLEIVITRDFDAPVALVFDVLTKPEYVRKTIAPFGEEVKECSIDLRVGGDYNFVLVTEDGTECLFRGTYLEVVPPSRIAETWHFGGWPDAEAVQSFDLHEMDGVTKLTHRLAFHDKTGREHMTRFDGPLAYFDSIEDLLRSLLDQTGTLAE